jgi:hypothetical protein
MALSYFDVIATFAVESYSWFLAGAERSPVSAPVWGTGGRGFKSRRSDQ